MVNGTEKQNDDGVLPQGLGLDPEFKLRVIPGNVKAAMKVSMEDAQSGDLWALLPQKIRLIDGFNVRVKTARFKEGIEALAQKIMREGYRRDCPIEGYVGRENGEDVFFCTNGHRRTLATLRAIELGAEILRIPGVTRLKGYNEVDLTLGLYESNTGGEPLTAYEVAVLCKRLVGYGWSSARIAERFNFKTGAAYVDGLLLLLSAPVEVQTMVQEDQVAVTTVIQVMRDNPETALEVLQAGFKSANAGHKEGEKTQRVTGKHLPAFQFKRSVKKAAPQMFEALKKLEADPGFQQLRPDMQEMLLQILVPLKEQDAALATVDDGQQALALDSVA